jgi:hypothetical protein
MTLAKTSAAGPMCLATDNNPAICHTTQAPVLYDAPPSSVAHKPTCGRHEYAGPAGGVAARATFERAREAFGCCNGRLGSYLNSRPVITKNANVIGVGSRMRKIGIA